MLVRLTSITWRHSASDSSCGTLRMLIPALLTRMSSRPRRATVSATILRHWVSSATLTSSTTVLTPSWASSAAAASAFLTLRPAMATVAPAWARPRAMPRPMPPLPPVTTATLPVRSKSFMAGSLLSVLHAKPGIEGVAEAVAEQVQAQAGQGERQAREQADPERLADDVLPTGDHVPP